MAFDRGTVPDGEDDQHWPTREAIEAWLGDAGLRRDREVRVDSLDELAQRLAALG